MSPSLPPPAGPPPTLSTETRWAPPAPPQALPQLDQTEPRARRPLILLAGVIALIALGVGALVVMTGSDNADSTSGPAGTSFSLAVALEETAEAQTLRFDMTMAAPGHGDVSVSGAVDNEAKLMTTTVDIESMIGIADADLLGDLGEIEMIIDIDRGVAYLSAEVLGGFLPVEASWVALDLESLAEGTGQSMEDLGAVPGIDTNGLATMLLDAGDVSELGVETIDGTETEHFTVTIDLAEIAEVPPQVQEHLDSADLDFELAELPDSIIYDVWVTEDNELRRVVLDQSVAGQEIRMEINLFAVDEPLDIVVPDEADVIDLTALMAF